MQRLDASTPQGGNERRRHTSMLFAFKLKCLLTSNLLWSICKIQCLESICTLYNLFCGELLWLSGASANTCSVTCGDVVIWAFRTNHLSCFACNERSGNQLQVTAAFACSAHYLVTYRMAHGASRNVRLLLLSFPFHYACTLCHYLAPCLKPFHLCLYTSIAPSLLYYVSTSFLALTPYPPHLIRS